MKRIMMWILVLAIATPTFSASAITVEEEVTVVDFRNKMCPIMGGPVAEGQYVEYKGMRYGICCPGCEAEFLKDPEKHIAKLKGES